MSGRCTIYMILCILINTECGKTESSCPSSVLRKAVANQSCLVIHNYHCLEMYPTPKHQQGCRLPKRIHEGKYPIFDGASKYINGIDCPQDRYQPKSSFSYEINKCIYVKSLCTEEGQVIYSNGSTTEDRSCRCDYTKGYNFVIKPKERCYCIPSVEDCTCYKQQCPNDNQVLSPDYECIISVNSAVFNCPKIESVNEQEDNHTKTVTVIISEIPGHRPVRNHSNSTASMILIVLLILFLLFYGILIINELYKTFLVQRFVKDLEDRTCNEGDSVTFSCEVTNKTAKVEWYKDGLPLKKSTNHRMKSHDGIHTLTLVQTSDMYRGIYSVRTRGKVSRSAKLEFTVSDDDNEKAFSELDVPSNINSAQEHKGKLTDKSSDRVVTDQDEVFDAVVIHPAQDEDSATEFIDHLNSLKNDLDIPDLNVIKHKGLIVPGVSFLQSFNGLFDKARFVMIIITERFKHSRLERFLAEKTLIESLMDEDKLDRVIPISMAGQQHIPDEFMTVIAVQYYHYRASELKGKKDRTYIGTLRKMFQNGRQNYLVK